MANKITGLTDVMVQYITTRGAEKLALLDKTIAKLEKSANPADQSKLEQEQQKRRDMQQKFVPRNWLTDAAKRAGQLQLVTHAPKFIHSDAKASGIYAIDTAQTPAGCVSSANLSQPAIDVIGNAAALDVGKLLQLQYQGKTLIEHVAADDIEPFMALAADEAQAKNWLAGFKQAVVSERILSHKLLKQVYWPTHNDTGQQYHLLAPLYQTSLQQQIYQTINSTRFTDTAKAAKAARKAGSNHDVAVVNFVEVAEQHYGGTKPQNISQLNSQRYGKGYLLNNAPPSWHSQNKPPLQADSIFNAIFDHRAGKQAKSLNRYLEYVYQRPSTIDIRTERAARIDNIIDQLFGYVSQIHQLPPGWSASPQCHLPLAEQLLLDPQRRFADPAFGSEWDKQDWPEQVAASFARWLNRYINGAKVEYVQWKGILKQKLVILQDDFSTFFIDDEKEQS